MKSSYNYTSLSVNQFEWCSNGLFLVCEDYEGWFHSLPALKLFKTNWTSACIHQFYSEVVVAGGFYRDITVPVYWA